MTSATDAWKLIEPYAQQMFDDLLSTGARRGSVGEYPLLLYDGDEIIEYAYSATGMAAAISASASGDTIFQPAGTISGNHTNKAGVTILGQGENSILSGTITNSGILNNIQVTGALSGSGLRINVIRETRSIISGTSIILTNSDYSVVCGGSSSIIQSDAGKDYNFIGGGLSNLVDDDGEKSSIVGGEGNQILGPFSFIGGGLDNVIDVDCDYSVIAGGQSNVVDKNNAAQSRWNFIGGGDSNEIEDAQYSVICGGNANNIDGAATALVYSAIVGGSSNTIDDSDYAFIGGGDTNVITNADYATIPGGRANDIKTGADYAFAQGRRAQVAHAGATLFADGTDADFNSAAANEFAVRATGGFRFIGSVQINPGLSDYDTIISGDTEPNLFRVDAGLDAVHLGDWDTNYSAFEKDGTLKMVGAATIFKDINLGAAVLTKPAATAPDEVNFVDEAGADTEIASLGFAVGEKVSGNFELQHDYKEGSDLVFHVHWQGSAAPTGTDKVKWQLTYTVAQSEATLDATTTIVVETDFDTQYEFKASAFAAITGTNFNIENQFLFTLERIAASADEYGGDAILATVGIHYECDTVGSRQILSK